MTETKKRVFDLEDRTLRFAVRVRAYLRTRPRNITYGEDYNQLLRASGSVGANYIEANESLSPKDFLMRIKICRKEAKECCYWFKVIGLEDANALALAQEAYELTSIFGAIVRKVEV